MGAARRGIRSQQYICWTLLDDSVNGEQCRTIDSVRPFQRTSSIALGHEYIYIYFMSNFFHLLTFGCRLRLPFHDFVISVLGTYCICFLS